MKAESQIARIEISRIYGFQPPRRVADFFGQVGPNGSSERGQFRIAESGVGKWLLAVVEGAGEPEEKLAKIQAFAFGLIAE